MGEPYYRVFRHFMEETWCDLVAVNEPDLSGMWADLRQTTRWFDARFEGSNTSRRIKNTAERAAPLFARQNKTLGLPVSVENDKERLAN